MILICGASGLVGKEMCKLLDENEINYIGTYNSNKINKNNMFKLNFNNANEIEEFMVKYNFGSGNIYYKTKVVTSCIPVVAQK